MAYASVADEFAVLGSVGGSVAGPESVATSESRTLGFRVVMFAKNEVGAWTSAVALSCPALVLLGVGGVSEVALMPQP